MGSGRQGRGELGIVCKKEEKINKKAQERYNKSTDKLGSFGRTLEDLKQFGIHRDSF